MIVSDINVAHSELLITIMTAALGVPHTLFREQLNQQLITSHYSRSQS
jgi:hypothetical protein